MPFFVCLFSSFISDVEQRTGVSEEKTVAFLNKAAEQEKKALLFFEFFERFFKEKNKKRRAVLLFFSFFFLFFFFLRCSSVQKRNEPESTVSLNKAAEQEKKAPFL